MYPDPDAWLVITDASVSKDKGHVRHMGWKRFHASSVLIYFWSCQEENRGSPIFFSLEIQMPCAPHGLETVPRIFCPHIFLVISRAKSRFTDFFQSRNTDAMCGKWLGNSSTHPLFSHISGHVKRKIAIHRFF
jgi:hypothetical protein